MCMIRVAGPVLKEPDVDYLGRILLKEICLKLADRPMDCSGCPGKNLFWCFVANYNEWRRRDDRKAEWRLFP